MTNKASTSIKSKLRNIKYLIILLKYKLSDAKDFYKYSFEFNNIKDRRHLESDLIYFAHKIEKGLSLPSPRLGFGEKVIAHVIKLLNQYNFNYGWHNVSVSAVNTLNDYFEYNKANGLELSELKSHIDRFYKSIETINYNEIGGVIEISKSELDKSYINFEDFAMNRYSIRNFATGHIDSELIKKAVHIAQKTPSVCNRQPWKTYVYEGNISELLKFQNGNAGFGINADKILIVTADLRDFRGPRERNQIYIDGGLFSMSLLYSLHSMGIGSCALNLAIPPAKEKNLKRIAGINEPEALIMMIAIGKLPEKLRVASSPRRNLAEVVEIKEV